MKLTQILGLASIASAFAYIEPKVDITYNDGRHEIFETCRPITDNTVYDCGSPSDTFAIKSVTLSPKAPKKGQNVTVTVTGTVKETIIKGTNLHIRAKLGLVTVVDEDKDFCDYIEDENNHCPINEGELIARKVIELPSNVPSGNYVITGVATTPNNKQVFSVQVKLKL